MTEYLPTGPISHHVECFWVAAPFETLMLIPDGTRHLVLAQDGLTLGGHWLARGGWFVDMCRQPMLLRTPGPLVGARLKAFVRPLPGFAGAEEQGAAMPLHCPELLALLHGHSGTDLTAKQQAALTAFVANRFVLHQRLREVINEVLWSKGHTTVRQVSDALSVSRQAVHKSCARHLGMPLKQLATHWQLSHFLLQAREQQSLTAAALECGFYDQAHCIRTFRQVYATAPSSFVAQHKGQLPALVASIKRRFAGQYDPRVAAG